MLCQMITMKKQGPALKETTSREEADVQTAYIQSGTEVKRREACLGETEKALSGNTLGFEG